LEWAGGEGKESCPNIAQFTQTLVKSRAPVSFRDYISSPCFKTRAVPVPAEGLTGWYLLPHLWSSRTRSLQVVRQPSFPLRTRADRAWRGCCCAEITSFGSGGGEFAQYGIL